MTPAARHQAAIEILDSILTGTPAEQALTRWARASRYAGSKDRAAVRDIVFEGLRRRRSAAARGGSETGRGLVLGLLAEAGADPASLFTGARYAPGVLSAAEQAHLATVPSLSRAEALDLPDWLIARLEADPDAPTEAIGAALRDRAPVFLRVNLRRATLEQAAAQLAQDGIETEPVPELATALRVRAGARRIAGSAAYGSGLVELQDAASQAAVLALPIPAEGRILDYCAGGGGKALAMAARSAAQVFAHDADPRRMRDLPDRAARAGVTIPRLETAALPGTGPFDLVLCDVPCSGSGTWRRTPDEKWRLTPDRLAELTALQREILGAASGLVAPGGTLAYATCSVLAEENDHQLAAFLAGAPGWQVLSRHQRWPDSEGDGFFFATVFRNNGEKSE